MAERKLIMGATLTPEDVRLLTVIAEQETESNKSMTLRKIIREAAAARGLTTQPKSAKQAQA